MIGNANYNVNMQMRNNSDSGFLERIHQAKVGGKYQQLSVLSVTHSLMIVGRFLPTHQNSHRVSLTRMTMTKYTGMIFCDTNHMTILKLRNRY